MPSHQESDTAKAFDWLEWVFTCIMTFPRPLKCSLRLRYMDIGHQQCTLYLDYSMDNTTNFRNIVGISFPVPTGPYSNWIQLHGINLIQSMYAAMNRVIYGGQDSMQGGGLVKQLESFTRNSTQRNVEFMVLAGMPDYLYCQIMDPAVGRAVAYTRQDATPHMDALVLATEVWNRQYPHNTIYITDYVENFNPNR